MVHRSVCFLYLASLHNAKPIYVTLERKRACEYLLLSLVLCVGFLYCSPLCFRLHVVEFVFHSLSFASRIWVPAVVGQRSMKAALSGCNGSAGWAMRSMST